MTDPGALMLGLYGILVVIVTAWLAVLCWRRRRP